jgi:hypothetical protein
VNIKIVLNKLVIVIIVSLGLSTAFADTFGVHVSIPFQVGVQYTLEDLAPAQDLRFRVNLAFGGGYFGALVQGDYFFGKTPLSDDGLFKAYYGAGGALGYGRSSTTVTGVTYSASAFLIGPEITGGVSYDVDPTISLFMEASAGYLLGLGSGNVGNINITIPVGGAFARFGIGANFRLDSLQ